VCSSDLTKFTRDEDGSRAVPRRRRCGKPADETRAIPISPAGRLCDDRCKGGPRAVVERASAPFVAAERPIGPIGGFLERFRRSGGVPASVGGELEAELAPVFVVLDALEREAEELRRLSGSASARHAYDVEEDAQSILAGARERAESERDDAFAVGLHAADAEAARIVAQAERGAGRIRELGEQRLPHIVAEVLERVLEAAS
jgi:vacuolar-type H+-ATPase subunit H